MILKRRPTIRVVFLTAILLLNRPSAGVAAVQPQPAVVSVALVGSPALAYFLCPQKSQTRKECISGKENAAVALDALRRKALSARVSRLVLFLPGFRTSLRNGRLAAQHIQDVLGPRFMVVHIDWGSHGSGTPQAYGSDGREAKRQSPALAMLAIDLHGALPHLEVDVFAHSMGSRVAAGAMAVIKTPRDGKPIVAETVLAAPDLGLTDYRHAILRDPEPFGHVTIYASRYDKALFLSSVIHLHKRIGQIAIWRTPIADTSVVDASAADPRAEGHGYAIHDPSVIRDIGAIFLEKPMPHGSWTRSGFPGTVWTLVPSRVPAN